MDKILKRLAHFQYTVEVDYTVVAKVIQGYYDDRGLCIQEEK